MIEAVDHLKTLAAICLDTQSDGSGDTLPDCETPGQLLTYTSTGELTAFNCTPKGTISLSTTDQQTITNLNTQITQIGTQITAIGTGTRVAARTYRGLTATPSSGALGGLKAATNACVAAYGPGASMCDVYSIYISAAAGKLDLTKDITGAWVYQAEWTNAFGANTADLSTFVVVHNVVQWNSATDSWGWVGSGAKPGVTTNGYSGFGTDVYALAVVGNSLFIGGKFNQAGGTAATGGLARWERAAEQWVSIDGSLGGIDGAHVRALAPSGGDLLVAGKFTTTGAAQARYVARFNTANNQWVGLGSGLRWYNDLYTTAYTVLGLPSGVYVAGEFDRAGEKGAMGFARWAGELGAPNLTPGQGGAMGANGVQATFPAGAVGENAVGTLAVTPKPLFDVPNGKAPLFGMQVGATTVSGKQLAQTAQPYTVQAQYTDAQLAAAGVQDPASLQLMAWDGGSWQPLPGGADVQNKLVTGTTNLLQPLALVGTKQGGGNNGGDNGGGDNGGQNGASKLYLPAITR